MSKRTKPYQPVPHRAEKYQPAPSRPQTYQTMPNRTPLFWEVPNRCNIFETGLYKTIPTCTKPSTDVLNHIKTVPQLEQVVTKPHQPVPNGVEQYQPVPNGAETYQDNNEMTKRGLLIVKLNICSGPRARFVDRFLPRMWRRNVRGWRGKKEITSRRSY